MKKFITLLITLIPFTCLAGTEGNNIIFRHIDCNDGLSHNGVMALYQDRRGFIWMGTRDGLNLYNGEEITTFKYDKDASEGLPDNNIIKITGDGMNTVYIKTRIGIVSYNIAGKSFRTVMDKAVGGMRYENGLYYSKDYNIFRYNDKTGKDSLVFSHPDTMSIITDISGSRDSLMIGTTKGLYLHTEDRLERLIPDIHVYDILKDSHGFWWICSYDGKGLFSMDSSCSTIKRYTHSDSDPYSLSHDQTNVCCEDKAGDIWIGTFYGLDRFDRKTGKFISYYRTGQPGDLSESSIWSLMTDRQGTIWAGTYYGGVNYCSVTCPYMRKYDAGNIEKYNLSSPIVGQITEDRSDNLWICTEGGGLCRFNMPSRQFKWYRHDKIRNSISHDHTKCVRYDVYRNTIWTGTHTGGLNRLDLNTGKITVYNQKDGLPSDIIMSIIPYRKKLILGTLLGVVLFDPDTGKVSDFINGTSPKRPNYIYSMMLDISENLWIIYDAGKHLCRYDIRTGKIKDYPLPTCKGNGGGEIKINSIYEDHSGKIWICTNGDGLYMMQNEVIQNFDRNGNGFASNVIYEIRELSMDRYILTTDEGISIFEYGNRNVKNYYRNKEIPLSSINEGSLYITADSEIYVGGMDGMVSFKKDFFSSKGNSDFDLYPYSLSINGKEMTSLDPGILKEDISLAESIHLKYDQNTFALKYTETNYMPNEKKSLEYTLAGYSARWFPIDNSNTITFTNLDPGEYTLKVRTASPNEANRKTHELNIRISPPFYASAWAYIIYILAAGTAAVLAVRIQNNRLRMKEQINYEKQRAQDIESMNQDKLQFFTSISHEFRTPISVITGQAKILMDKYIVNKEIYLSLQRIFRSCTQLDELIDELLEFRKLDRGFLTIKVREQDIVETIHSFYLQYQAIARDRGIKFIFNRSHDRIFLWFDRKQMNKVVSNLLSNAFKYVGEAGIITLSVRKGNGEALIEVTNTGSVIAAEDIEKIFNRFYQVNGAKAGTGIGLHLVKGIVEKHHGKIDVYSTPGENSETTFCVHLPLDKAVFADDETASETETAEVSSVSTVQISEAPLSSVPEPTEDKEHTVLIVEDNMELRNMLIDMLSPFYNILYASDGVCGLQVATEKKPDLILSDVIMPGLNGIELCKKLKKSADTRHIPITLLSANIEKEHIIAAFNAGADEFVKKPFDVNILITRCSNLIKNRLYPAETNYVRKNSENSTGSNIQEQKFLAKAKETVLEHLEDSSFDANGFAFAMGVSRTLLFSRLKAITGLTPKEFILNVKMDKASQMLLENLELNITEIGDRLGFSSLKYFRKCFKDKFGVSPSEYRGVSRTDEGA